MNDTNTIKFDTALIKRLNGAMATAHEAVAEAAMSAVAQDRKVTVRSFIAALKVAAPALTAPNAVFTAAVKAAKEKDTSLVKVADAMASALEKKRADDRKRASDRAAAAPGKALQKALAEVDECKRALRSPLEVARDKVAEAEQAVKQAEQALEEAVKREDEARNELADLVAALEAAPKEA